MICLGEISLQSPHSPSTVEDGETLIKILYSPDHVKSDGSISLAAIQRKDLEGSGVEGKGVSVARLNFSSPEDLRSKILDPALKNNIDRQEAGVLIAMCSSIRSLHDPKTGARLYCVIDDGTPSIAFHALLIFSEPTRSQGFWQNRETAWQRDALRHRLLDQFTHHSSIESCFEN